MKSHQRARELQTLLQDIGSFIARGTYLHPKSMALIANYEQKGLTKLRKRKGRGKIEKLLFDLRRSGFGEPKQSSWQSLIRFTLVSNQIIGKRILRATNEILNYIGSQRRVLATVVNNNFTNEQYIDITYEFGSLSAEIFFDVIWKIYLWFCQKAKAASRLKIREIKNYYPNIEPDKLLPILKRAHKTTIKRSIADFAAHGPDILSQILRFLIISELRVNLCCPTILMPVAYRVCLPDGERFENYKEIFQDHKNFYFKDKDKLKEIECLESEIRKNKSDVLIICLCSVQLSNIDGTSKDEWDGVILSLSENQNSLSVYEIKNRGTRSVSTAFKQLKKTKSFLKNQILKQARRQRLTGYGAKLVLK